MQTVIYNSNKHTYEAEISLKILSMSKTSKSNIKTINEVFLFPSQIVVYDYDEIIQIDITVDSTNKEQKNEFDKLLSSMYINEIAEQNPDKFIWSSISVIPNKLHTQNKMELYTINSFIASQINETLLLSVCGGISNVNLILNNTISTGMDFRQLDKIADYEILTEEEKTFIENNILALNCESYIAKKNGKLNTFFSNVFGVKVKDEDSGEMNINNLIASLHLTEQEKKIFDPEMLTLSEGYSNSEQALENLIGLDNVKEEIKKLKAKLKYRKRQKERGITVEDSASMHMCFTGAPGTGKTTVARIITGILYDMGYIKENRCIEVNGQNLKGGYQGQTAIITKLILKSAKNKVLFIDEAYSLFDGYQNGYGKEAIAVILKQMEDERDNTTIIFAGYKNDMEQFLRMNDGLKSRINRYIDFKNYNTEELTKIMILLLKKKKLYITESALSKCVLAFKKAESTERFSNARFVRNLVEKIEYEHAYNTHGTKDTKRQDTITDDDVSDEIINELLTHSM